MANRIKTLTPIITPYRAPIERVIYDNVLGTENVVIYGGNCEDERQVPGIWELLSLDADIVADATIVNRQAFIATGKGGGSSQSAVQSINITASQTVKIRIQKVIYYSNMVPGSGTVYYCGVGDKFCYFSGDEYLTFMLLAGVAGDVYQFEATFECKNRILGVLPQGLDDPHRAY